MLVEKLGVDMAVNSNKSKFPGRANINFEPIERKKRHTIKTIQTNIFKGTLENLRYLTFILVY